MLLFKSIIVVEKNQSCYYSYIYDIDIVEFEEQKSNRNLINC
ncbi:hypothetical protein FTV88_2880 [Heliorestis convoluta]|uniref:Uncharacterized protein n=1 Tax=Heliorestis convoluta TaxID=356322 RepID=A0A5Q2N501_9FIRM|nr:hypothetical protein FTV88_2880 [Heliorestis convoluta]